ncbi:hypothetical protein EDC04DRAFT_2598027 [Pisolithus marmoratus]|nr:hypothetical protein EDC04DRAFT_2598027 [Pisolithus marmoratus]
MLGVDCSCVDSMGDCKQHCDYWPNWTVGWVVWAGWTVLGKWLPAGLAGEDLSSSGQTHTCLESLGIWTDLDQSTTLVPSDIGAGSVSAYAACADLHQQKWPNLARSSLPKPKKLKLTIMQLNKAKNELVRKVMMHPSLACDKVRDICGWITTGPPAFWGNVTANSIDNISAIHAQHAHKTKHLSTLECHAAKAIKFGVPPPTEVPEPDVRTSASTMCHSSDRVASLAGYREEWILNILIPDCLDWCGLAGPGKQEWHVACKILQHLLESVFPSKYCNT